MSRPRREKPASSPYNLVAFSMGPGNRLYSEDYYLKELEPLGVTRKGFRAWLRALKVPTLEIGDVRLVDNLTFSIALRAALRIGQPDFLGPKSVRRAKNRLRGATVSLDVDQFVRDHSVIIGELLIANNRRVEPRTLRKAARKAAYRLASLGLQELAGTFSTQDALAAYNRAHAAVHGESE